MARSDLLASAATFVGDINLKGIKPGPFVLQYREVARASAPAKGDALHLPSPPDVTSQVVLESQAGSNPTNNAIPAEALIPSREALPKSVQAAEPIARPTDPSYALAYRALKAGDTVKAIRFIKSRAHESASNAALYLACFDPPALFGASRGDGCSINVLITIAGQDFADLWDLSRQIRLECGAKASYRNRLPATVAREFIRPTSAHYKALRAKALAR